MTVSLLASFRRAFFVDARRADDLAPAVLASLHPIDERSIIEIAKWLFGGRALAGITRAPAPPRRK